LFALIPVWLVFAILLKRQKFGPNLRNIVGFVLVSLVVMAPLNYYFSQHPDEYAAPLNRVRVDQEWLTHEVEIRQEPASKIVSELFLNSVKIIVIGGSGNFFYDSGTPVLRMAEAAIFMIGFLFLFLKPRDNRHWLLFLWLFFFTVSGALSLPNPSVHRYVALCVCFALVFAIGLDELQALFSQVWKDKVRWIFIAALAVSVLVALDDIRFYLFDYAPRGALGGVNTLLADRVARYVIDNYDSDDDLQLAFLNTPRMGYSSIMALPFLTPDFEGFDYPHEVGSPDNPQLTADQVMFIVLPEREAELQTLKDMYPGGTLVTRIFEENQDILFWLYIVDLN
jgi:hypothetical protein